ncbi:MULTISPECIES: ABC transporter permease [Brachybacterium]|uniref:ABC transporter permease n=1 Tax=Brachybacterium TaxID=43668 RepID=UPI0010CD5142|nr:MULTISPECIES: ABC transporter permease [Brachybacterium]MCW1805531.1 ABC transporter permease [Brachybacterium squillarum]QCR52382.1 hypothetical protein C1N80_01490 [Brachybacterium sp. SGAir0954]
MPAIVGLSRAELTLLVRNRTQLFLALAFPPAITVFFAALLKDQQLAPAQLIPLLGAQFVIALVFIVYYNLLSTYVARRQELVLKRLRTGEASDATVLAAAAVPALAIAAVMTVLMTVLAIVLMDLPLPERPVLVIAGIAAGALVMVPFALLTANRTRTVEAAGVTSLPVIALLVIGAGAIPTDGLPEVAQRAISLIPSAAMDDLLQLGWLAEDPWSAALKPLGVLVAWLVLGLWAVRREMRWEPRG